MAISSPADIAREGSASAPAILPGRTCGSCTLCCKTVAVTELGKPAGAWCSHCRRSRGCSIYESRPAGCRDFHCEWMRSEKLGREWKPDRARFALMATATGHLAACVDPGFPQAWRRPPYYQALRRWARERADSPTSSWPGVDVWIGKRCILILPDGETDLEIVAADEEVRIDCTMTLAGPVFAATKFKVADSRSRQAGGRLRRCRLMPSPLTAADVVQPADPNVQDGPDDLRRRRHATLLPRQPRRPEAGRPARAGLHV